MSSPAIEIEDAVDKLLAVLDEDIRHIRKSLSRLDDLRHSVIKRDDASLHKLLEDAQSGRALGITRRIEDLPRQLPLLSEIAHQLASRALDSR